MNRAKNRIQRLRNRARRSSQRRCKMAKDRGDRNGGWTGETTNHKIICSRWLIRKDRRFLHKLRGKVNLTTISMRLNIAFLSFALNMKPFSELLLFPE
jgi:hypothetical protein